MAEVIQLVAVKQLRESPTNPRRHFDAEGLHDLAESVRAHGILNPLLVRRSGREGQFEVVCGARRLRAAKRAGLEQAPVRVVELTADQVLEIQVVENLQREDVHPLDEGAGYRQLMETGRYTVADVALKVGKSESYVYQRMRLGSLAPELEKRFWEDKLKLGHAVLLARLAPEMQRELVEECLDEFDPMSPRELEQHIHDRVLVALKGAPWKPSDATLAPEAGSCTDCAKRTGASPALFPEVKRKDICTDPACFRRKTATHIERRLTEYRDRGEELLQVTLRYGYRGDNRPKGILSTADYTAVEEEGPCDHARAAIVVWPEHESGIGTTLLVCVEPKCKQHGQGSRRAPDHRLRQEEKRRKEELRLQALFKAAVRERVLAAVMQERPLAAERAEHLLLIARALVDGLGWLGAQEAAAAYGLTAPQGGHADALRVRLRDLKEGDPGELCEAVVRLAVYGFDGADLFVLADEWGVDVNEIERQFKGKAKASGKGAAAKKKTAKGKRQG